MQHTYIEHIKLFTIMYIYNKRQNDLFILVNNRYLHWIWKWRNNGLI